MSINGKSATPFMMSKTSFSIRSLLFLSLFFASCTRSPFQVHLEYISKEQLASYHVGTPDPRLVLMPVGQRVVIQWKLHEPVFELGVWKIVLHFRYKNQSEGVTEFILKTHRGMHIYELADREYFSTEGILAWKAELVLDEEVLLVKQHLLWTKLIEFTP